MSMRDPFVIVLLLTFGAAGEARVQILGVGSPSWRVLDASRYSEFPSHPRSSPQPTRVFGVPLGVP